MFHFHSWEIAGVDLGNISVTPRTEQTIFRCKKCPKYKVIYKTVK